MREFLAHLRASDPGPVLLARIEAVEAAVDSGNEFAWTDAVLLDSDAYVAWVRAAAPRPARLGVARVSGARVGWWVWFRGWLGL